jgi:hypothetical protein
MTRARLLTQLWLGIGALVLGACGGNVVVDGPQNAGTGGTGAIASSASNGTGGSICPVGTCKLSPAGPCQPPGGPVGNGCCKCGTDGLCAVECRCASPDTPIATPTGERPIASLREGDIVYSVEGAAVTAVPILATHQTAVSAGHRVVRVRLAGGATLEVSHGHPTLDGRVFGDLRAGDRLGGEAVVSVEDVPYPHDRTYDILPASDSGGYFAGGALIGSTLRPAAQVHP